ncbi:thioredoxin family protein [Flavicella marina]|uniref:thioredoxin family protein n=1 Tax=Flavicella marina TaxID=1475951 RepID=UPI001265810B|nr:thioredoxin family protein [Flavicella marina]
MEATISKKPQMYSYKAYTEEVISLFDKGLVSGDVQSEALLQTTEMNLHRMKRHDAKTKLSDEIIALDATLKRKLSWYVLIEGWCADGSQNLPIIAKMADAFSNIELKIMFRDENPEIMNQYLTNGGKAVPKLICFDSETNEELGTWGPRPMAIQEKVVAYKETHPEMDKNDFAANLHKWYAKDKSKSIQSEFVELIKNWR